MPEANTYSLQEDLELLVAAAQKGGKIALSYFGNSPKSWTKEGDSPVSVADIEVDQYLASSYAKHAPNMAGSPKKPRMTLRGRITKPSLLSIRLTEHVRS